MNIVELVPIHDARKSFYGKAKVHEYGETKSLYSYDTKVASICPGDNGRELHLLSRWKKSQTTLRHVKEFATQNGFTIPAAKDRTEKMILTE